MAPKSKKKPVLDEALVELESLVERLESGDLPLVDAMREFERGVELTRYCQDALKDAEQKVEILMQKTKAAAPEAFDEQDED